MSEKKLSNKYLNQKKKNETLNMNKTLEERINTDTDTVKIIKKRIPRKKNRA